MWVTQVVFLAESAPADEEQAKRLRALAALKARVAPQPVATQDPPSLLSANGEGGQSPPNGGQLAATGTGARHENNGAGPPAAEVDHEDQPDAQGEGDAWAEDHDARDAALFDADIGQDYDNQLNASEQHWEEQNFAQKLPPGWAKCPNSGSELAGLFPTKVCLSRPHPSRGTHLVSPVAGGEVACMGVAAAWWDAKLRPKFPSARAWACCAPIAPYHIHPSAPPLQPHA